MARSTSWSIISRTVSRRFSPMPAGGRLDWDKEFIRIYLDDELLNEIDLSKTFNEGYDGNRENPLANDVVGFKHYLLLNLAIGSNGGEPDDSQFPLRYYIDYVRVYQ